MTDPTVRVRFAPSPTGYLHVGGARTALFNWLFARSCGGTFILRIEDTDRSRSLPEHTQAILDGLEWLGIDVDEGPYFQAEGVERHRTLALGLLESGAAYRCFCTPAELAARREAASRTGAGYGYDGRCGRLPAEQAEERHRAGEPSAVRFRAPDAEIAWQDRIHGELRFPGSSIDDFIILRSDGTPVYNLAVVSDDLHAQITHVIRGDDHISNTPKQILIYEAAGEKTPVFGHVPLILGPDGGRLSKRHGAMSVLAYRDDGYLAGGIVNFLALLGWSPGDDRELLTRQELIRDFSLDRVVKKSAVFDMAKLQWLNGRHIGTTPSEVLARHVVASLPAQVLSGIRVDSPRLVEVIDLVKSRPRTLPALAAQVSPFFAQAVSYEETAVRRFWKRPAEVVQVLRKLREVLEAASFEDLDELEVTVRGVASEVGIGAGRVINPLRLALMGQGVSPGIFEVMAMMEWPMVCARIDAAVDYLSSEA